MVDSVCPLVTKVHHEVKVRAGKGYQIVYVGHEGHEEAVGTMAVAPDAIHRVETVAEVDALPAFDRAGRPAGPDHAVAPRLGRAWPTPRGPRFPSVWTPGRSDLCFATTNRQSALMAMAARCDAIVVIGSANSSNTRALEKLAIEAGCARVHRVNHADELPDDLRGVVGVTAGASAPEELVDAVIARLAPRNGVEEVRVTDEDEYFPPPRNLRELQAAVGLAATVLLGGTLATRPALDDRAVAASAVLAALGSLRPPCCHRRCATIRLFVHVLAACVWVGGQFVLGGLVPPLRVGVPRRAPPGGAPLQPHRLAGVRRARGDRHLEPDGGRHRRHVHRLPGHGDR